MKTILKSIFILILLGVVSFSSFIVGTKAISSREDGVPNVTVYPDHYPTGYEVLEELNAYRRKNNLPDLIVSYDLCNNIAERWQNYKSTNSHDGLQEFIDEWMPEGITISEILAPGYTAKEMVDGWAASPSHDTRIKRNSKACVYAAEGYAVALLSN